MFPGLDFPDQAGQRQNDGPELISKSGEIGYFKKAFIEVQEPVGLNLERSARAGESPGVAPGLSLFLKNHLAIKGGLHPEKGLLGRVRNFFDFLLQRLSFPENIFPPFLFISDSGCDFGCESEEVPPNRGAFFSLKAW